MRRSRSPIALALAGLALAVSLPGSPAAAREGCDGINAPSVRLFFERWEQTLESGDAVAMARRYATDAIFIPALTDAPLSGRSAIEQHFKGFLKTRPKGRVESRTIQIGCAEALDTGIYVFGMDGPSPGARMLVRIRYSMAYQVRDGRWMIVHHHASRLPEDDSEIPPYQASLQAKVSAGNACTLRGDDGD